jgi:DNA-binding LacI/PurR family transcriptional regulator
MKKAKFTDLANKLIESIENKEFQPGDMLPSQHELANKHGLSRSCIQKALDILDKNSLIERRPGKGIFVKQKTAPLENRVKKIAYIMPDYMRTMSSDLDNYGLKILLGVEQAASRIKANLTFKRIDINSDILSNAVMELGVDGVIVHNDISDEDIKKLCILNFPVVVAGRISELPDAGAVAPNFIDSFLGIFRRLAAEGIKRISFVYNGKESSTLEMPILKELASFTGISQIDYIDYAGDSGNVRAPIKTLIEKGSLPEVFCCFNDWGAKHVISALNELGKKAPEDTGVIGAVNLEFSTFMEPPLTTLLLDPSLIGIKAVELLETIINGGTPFTERIPMQLIQRESFIFKTKNEKV